MQELPTMIFLKVLTDDDLTKVIQKLIIDGKEINGENIYLESKNYLILYDYMDILNKIILDRVQRKNEN